ncbi:BTAD domain-containing putative transcriptional regulator [Kribbella sp. NPDC056951]|uniref:AfsR/SARP family transcriptional regulator n=1 Tax=Kribbella sp. NPDC056951 TaxID=3345978 RepID=UPI0036261471
MTEQLRIEILGPLRVLHHDKPIAVGAHRLQALLAVLALRANQVCTPEELLDLVWHDNPPGTGLKVLPPYIYRLRRALPSDILHRTPDGYVLQLSPGSLDIDDFEGGAAQASQLRDDNDLDAAAAAYAEALAYFRGEPLAGLPGDYLAAQRLRLTERRDTVFAERVEVDLDRGQAANLVAELVPAAAARPFDERLTGQLMRALTADGRQAEALELYTQTRRTLLDQLGVEPGPALREIHRTILRNESATGPRDELPATAATFVGRKTEVARLAAALDGSDSTAPPVVAIDGMAGIGKTALAVHLARSLSTRYPDGILFVDLHGHTPGHPPRDAKAALDHLLAGVGIAAARVPRALDDAQTLWRSSVAGRQLLVVLDNAPDSATVLPLLPGSPSCGVLITSRSQLTGLDGRDRLHLDLLAADDASALLAHLVGAARATNDVAASNDLIERCGHLPLAIQIAGARLRRRPGWSVAQINQRLDRVESRLTELTADGFGIAAAFELSYQQLSADQQRLFRLLSLLPGQDIDEYGAAALTGLDPHEASDLAESLVDANLLLQATPGRYQFHDLIRQYATDLAGATETPEALAAAGDRLLGYYLQVSVHPMSLKVGMPYFDPGRPPTYAEPDLDTPEKSIGWSDAESGNLAAAVERAAGLGHDELTWQLALTSVAYLYRQGKIQQKDRVLELAAAAARRLGDREAETRVIMADGRMIRGDRGARAAAERIQQALDRWRPGDDLRLLAFIHLSLGEAQQTLDPYGAALPALHEAIRLARDLADDHLLGNALTTAGILHNNVLEYEAARPLLEEAVPVSRRGGTVRQTVSALMALSASYVGLDRAADAVETATRAHDLAVERNSPGGLAFVLGALGRAHQLAGDLDRALAALRQAVAEARKEQQKFGLWTTTLNLGDALLVAGDVDEAADCYHSILKLALVDQDHLYMLDAWRGLSDHAVAIGDPEAAAEYLSQAIAVAEEFAPPHADVFREKLEALTG